MADNNVVYMVGWCPDCGRTVVVRHEEEWTCGCGHDLLNLTSCFSPMEVAEAVALMETVKNDALREPDAICRPTLAEEARCEDDGDDDCKGCPLCRKDGDSTDSDELPGEGELRMFMVSPTPFPVWVRGEDWVDAAHVLRGDIEELAIAGFSAALKEGSVHLSAVPVSDDDDAPGIVMLAKVVRE